MHGWCSNVAMFPASGLSSGGGGWSPRSQLIFVAADQFSPDFGVFRRLPSSGSMTHFFRVSGAVWGCLNVCKIPQIKCVDWVLQVMRLSFSIPLFNLPKLNPKMTVYGAKELEADLTLTVTVVVRLGGWLTVMRFGGFRGLDEVWGEPGWRHRALRAQPAGFCSNRAPHKSWYLYHSGTKTIKMVGAPR